MVIGFAKDHQHLSDQELQMLALKIREGDISPVLKEYEKAIKVILIIMIRELRLKDIMS
jgi:hypothetical protein